MKKQGLNFLTSLVIVMATGFMLNSCIAQGIKGSGDVVKEERQIGSFNAIEVGGAFDIILKQGTAEKCMVEADDNLIGYIVTEVKGNTLKIYQEKGFRDAGELNLYISFVELENIEISGAAELEAKDKLELGDFGLIASGASEVEMELEAAIIRLNISGATEVKMKGNADKLKGDFSGASEFDGWDLKVKEAEIEASGSSDVEINVSEELKIDASGASSVDFKGNPRVMKHVSGAADVDQN